MIFIKKKFANYEKNGYFTYLLTNEGVIKKAT